MPYNGSGTFQRLYSWQTDAANGIKIRADRMDNEDDGFATGLSTAICKDGQQTLTGNIPFSGMKITGYGTTNSPNARSDVPQLGQVQDSGAQWGSTSGGSADAQTITLSPAITAYAAGQTFRFIAGYTNATTTPTLSVNSLAAKTVRKENGALAAGDITAGRTYVVVYDGTYLQLVNPAMATFGTPTRTTSTKTADYTVLSADKNTLFFGNSGSNRTLTLIAAATAAAGFNIGFVNISTGNWTIDGNSSETIDGETTIVVPPLQGVELYCDGSNWHITATSNYKPQQAVVMIGDGLTARTTNGFGSYTASKVTTNQVMLTGAAYDATTAEYGQFRFRLPPDFDASGSFYAQVAWWHGSTTTNFGVSWNVQMLAVSDDDTLDAAFGTAIEITDTGGTTNDLYHTAWSTAITPAGSAAANDWLYVELYRNPAAAGDTLAVDAVVIGLTILVPFKKFGNSNKDI